jgi:hypothetical protein
MRASFSPQAILPPFPANRAFCQFIRARRAMLLAFWARVADVPISDLVEESHATANALRQLIAIAAMAEVER